MEGTNTTDLSLSYTTAGYVDYEANMEYICSSLPDRLMIFAGVCLGICLGGLVGNGIVMWFLSIHKKQNPFTTYILNLAVADFSLLLLFFLLMLALLSLTAICSYLYNFISFYLEFVYVVEFLCDFFDLSSLGLLTALSVERCILVFFPAWHRCHRPKHLSGVVSGVLWALAAFSVSSMYLASIAESYETVFVGVNTAISVILSSVMLISSLCQVIKLQCGSQRRHPGKLCVAVLLNVIFFFALSILFSEEDILNLPSTYKLFPECFLLDLLNCSINPFTYFVVGSCQQCRFQVSVKAAFQRVLEDKEVSEEDSHVPEDTVVETTV